MKGLLDENASLHGIITVLNRQITVMETENALLLSQLAFFSGEREITGEGTDVPPRSTLEHRNPPQELV
jgi:hypothetical protein